MTVLIVEDNAGVRRLIRRALSATGSEIRECDDGAYALAAFEAHRPDVVLMDIRMPILDGLAATRQILHSHPGARIVIVTDYDDDELRDAAQAAGASGYVLKLNLMDVEAAVLSAAKS